MAAGTGVYDGLSQFSSGGSVSASVSSSSSSLSGREISQQFIAHFYKTLAQDVNSLFALYEDDSAVIRVDSDEEKNGEKPAWYTDKPKKGQVEIHEVSIALPVSKVHIKSFDVCESGHEILLLVDGSLLFQHKTERSFSHAFVLAPLAAGAGYYIKNEILRFHAQQQQHAQQVTQQQPNTAAVHVHHTQNASEDSSAHTQANHHTHTHGHLHHAHLHAHAQPQVIEHAVDHSVQNNEELVDRLHAENATSHSVSSSPSKSPLKSGKDKRRKPRHEPSQLDHASEQKQAEEPISAKVEEVIVQAEPAPLVVANEVPAVTVALVDSAPVSVVIEEKAAPVEIQPTVAHVVSSAPAAVVSVAPKEEKKPRSWAHVVNKNAPATNAAAQPAAAPAAVTPVVKAAVAASSSSTSASSGPSRPPREFPGTVLVSGVPATAKNDDVKLFFSTFGTVTNTRAVTQAGKTSVYVTFASNASANAVANQSTINFLGVALQVSRSNAAAASESEGDDGFQQSQNRRHARAQERKQEKQTPPFSRGGARGGAGSGRGRGGRGGSRGGRGGVQSHAQAQGQTQSNGSQAAPATPAATSG